MFCLSSPLSVIRKCNCAETALFLQPSNAATPLDDEADYIVSDGNSAEDLLDDSNDLVGDLPAPPLSVSTPPVQRLPSNEDSGAEVALHILALCIDLFGSATAQDYEQMLQVGAHITGFCSSAP